MSTTAGGRQCPCCYGTGVQLNRRTGLRQKCPCCGGTGIDHEGQIIKWQG